MVAGAGDSRASDVKVGKTSDTSSVAQLSHDVGVKMVGEAYPLRTAMSLPVSGPGDAQIVSAPAAAAPAVIDAAPFDKSKSVSQLIQDGSIRRSEAPSPTPEVAKPGAQAGVTVTYADAAANDPTKVPDFIIKKDGSIEATGDFEALQRKNVVVQVERTPGDTSDPNEAQKNSIDKVVSYAYDRLGADPTVAQTGLKLNDEFGLISENLVKKLATNGDPGIEPSIADSRRDFSPESQRAMSNMSRMTPGSQGSMSRGDVERQFPPREVPTLPGETDRVQDTKNAVAGMFNPDKAAPYETVRVRNNNYEVGRYGMNYPVMRDYFYGLGGFNLDEMDEDGFIAMLGKLDKDGKLPKSFAKFKKKDGSFDKEAVGKFLKFAKGMKEGHKEGQPEGVTAADVKANLPKEMQEEMAMSLVEKYNKAGGDSAGKTALAFHLGKGPDQFTQTDLSDKGNQEYMRSADRLAQLSGARHGMGENDRLDYKISTDGTSMDAKIVNRAFSHARSVGTTGWCAKEFQIAWANTAPELMGSGDGVQMTRAFQRSDKFQQVDWQTAQEAMRGGKAVAVTRTWDPSVGNTNRGGHVATLAMQNGKIMEASDHVTQFSKNNGRYQPDKDKFFVYTG
jgi:hypothetical protein